MSAVVELREKPSLLARMADRFGVDAGKMMVTLKETAFKGNVTDQQMMALLIVAEQYGLNPWTKEIYAFPDRSGIVPVVGVDGWSRIINEKPECDGIQFKEADDGSWIECTIFRKDRAHPTTAREWLSECKRDTAPWKSHPRRMLRHKALIQCARIAFGFGGIFDQDEAERIVDVTPKTNDPRGDLSAVDESKVQMFVDSIRDALDAGGGDEIATAAVLREIDVEMNKWPEVYMVVADRLAKQDIISKANWKKYLKVGMDRGATHA
jgi:phage recombination protein Bet